MTTELVSFQERTGALSVADVRAQVNLIQEVMREVMQGPSKDHPEGIHYGIIPGTPKPTLYKAGAEKLCLTFRLDPQYEIEQLRDGQHLNIVSKCILHSINSGQRCGSGMGSCSTRESKYAYRKGSRKCPACSSEAIIKGKEEWGGGWVCFKKKGGCGAKFLDGDKTIEAQSEGRVQNEDIADQYNTVLKMANKRSLVAAVLNTTAASDIFTQDIEDMPDVVRNVEPVAEAPKRAKRQSQSEVVDAETGEITTKAGSVADLPADKLENAFDVSKVRAEDAKALDACMGLDTLQEEFGERWTAAKGDAARRSALKAVYEDCKAKLTPAPAVDPFVADMERAEATQAKAQAVK